MTDSAPTSKSPNDRPPGMPGWVKVLGIIALVVIALFVMLQVAGMDHGPNMHGGSLYEMIL